MTDIAVVHLVRGANPDSSFTQFLDSYANRPAGIAHRLVIAFKGYEEELPRMQRHIALARDAGAQPIVLDRDDRFDIGAYFDILREVSAQHYCFFNSFSRLLCRDWLALLYDAVRRPGVGAAGATGSWESQASNALFRFAGHPDRRRRHNPLDLARWLRDRAAYPAAPNPHLRTNSFIISHDALAALQLPNPAVWSKAAAHRFECGHAGMSRQLCRRGFEIVVAGRDGGVYSAGRWPQSSTYRAGCQRNLLVEDNRTIGYANASLQSRIWMEIITWGKPLGRAAPQES